MARFSGPSTPHVTSPRMGVAPTYGSPVIASTYEGGSGFAYTDPQTELFLAAVSGLLKDQFYESGDERVRRLVDLVAKCDPDWLRAFATWLRTEANLRSAPIVIAAEYVRAGFPNGRNVVNSVLRRADEPGEILAYWRGAHGRSIPMAIKRGVADATTRLYTEVAVTRYDGTGKGWRFGDVIETVHPKAIDSNQSALFKYLLSRRRHPETAVPAEANILITDRIALGRPEADRTLDTAPPKWHWERLAGWLPGGMTAAAWEHVIPNMGYMALIRNLRNFEEKGVSVAVLDAVAKRIADPDEVRKSKQLPFRFFNAYINVTSDRWKWPLTQALEVSVENLPHLVGNTLLMVDCSGSMAASIGTGQGKGKAATRSQIAALYAWSLAERCERATVVTYGSNITSHWPDAQRSDSVMAKMAHRSFVPDAGGTYTWASTTAANNQFGPFDRIVVITDEQAHDRDTNDIKIPVVTWNLAGYDTAHAAHGLNNRYSVGGYSDTVLHTLPAVLGLGDGRWPWE